MPYEPPFNTTPAIENLCMEIAELVGRLQPSSDLSTNPHLHRKLRIRTIRSSLMIEGNTLPEEAVSAVIDGRKVLGPHRDILEVQNAHRAYEMMGEIDPLSISDLLRIHAVMMGGLVDDAGLFRSKNAGVFDGDSLIHMGTPARYVPGLMGELFDWMRSTELHPLIVSCIFHYEFEFIHPFADGNGRTGRLWHTLILSRWRPMFAWLPIESVILDRQQGYYAAFALSESEGSCAPFVAFMLQVIRDAMLPYVQEESDADIRMGRILAFFSEHPKATVGDLAAYLGCSRRSAERGIAAMKASGKLVRHGSPRAGTWEVLP